MELAGVVRLPTDFAGCRRNPKNLARFPKDLAGRRLLPTDLLGWVRSGGEGSRK
jgi:hypothetical protein